MAKRIQVNLKSVITLLILAVFLFVPFEPVQAYSFSDRDWTITTGNAAASTATRISPAHIGKLWIQFYGGDTYLLKNATPNVGNGIFIPDGGSIDFENAVFNYTDYLVCISASAVSYNYIPTN